VGKEKLDADAGLIGGAKIDVCQESLGGRRGDDDLSPQLFENSFEKGK
jgi:hypothetical protein